MKNLLKIKLLRVVLVTSLVNAIVYVGIASGAQTVFEGAEVVKFESASYTYLPTPFAVKQAKKLGVLPKSKIESSVRLTGYLAIPEGEGPHPAVVLLHTCAGISEHEEAWSAELVAWGYVVLTVDSLTPRELEYICDNRPGSPAPWNRALDAYGAKSFLSTRPFVDLNRIAVMGMSHGARAVLEVIKQSTSADLEMNPFRAAVTFYPLCNEPKPINTPTLIMVGSEDNWTPADLCVQYFDRLPHPHELTLKVFLGAHHAFDHPDIDIVELGYIIRSDPEAGAQANRMTREFLSEHL